MFVCFCQNMYMGSRKAVLYSNQWWKFNLIGLLLKFFNSLPITLQIMRSRKAGVCFNRGTHTHKHLRGDAVSCRLIHNFISVVLHVFDSSVPRVRGVLCVCRVHIQNLILIFSDFDLIWRAAALEETSGFSLSLWAEWLIL